MLAGYAVKKKYNIVILWHDLEMFNINIRQNFKKILNT